MPTENKSVMMWTATRIGITRSIADPHPQRRACALFGKEKECLIHQNSQGRFSLLYSNMNERASLRDDSKPEEEGDPAGEFRDMTRPLTARCRNVHKK